MDDAARIYWVQKNRRRRADRTTALGEAAVRVVGGATGAAPPEALLACWAKVADDEFRAHCRVAVENGGIVLYVDRPEWLYPMRMRWLETLHVALLENYPGRRTPGIDFRLGKAGVSVPPIGSGAAGLTSRRKDRSSRSGRKGAASSQP